MCTNHSTPHTATGHFHSELPTCESFLLSANTWHSLPSMHYPRSYFTPCAYHSHLYLCGSGTSAIEVFDYLNLTYQPCNFHQIEDYPCLTFIENNELVIISAHFLQRFQVKTGLEMELIDEMQHEDWDLRSTFLPLVDTVNSSVYYCVKGRCCRVDLKNCRLEAEEE